MSDDEMKEYIKSITKLWPTKQCCEFTEQEIKDVENVMIRSLTGNKETKF